MKITIRNLTSEPLTAEELHVELDGAPLAGLLACVSDPEKRAAQLALTFETMEKIGGSEIIQNYVAGCVSAFVVGCLRGWAKAKAEAQREPLWRRGWQLLTDALALRLGQLEGFVRRASENLDHTTDHATGDAAEDRTEESSAEWRKRMGGGRDEREPPSPHDDLDF